MGDGVYGLLPLFIEVWDSGRGERRHVAVEDLDCSHCMFVREEDGARRLELRLKFSIARCRSMPEMETKEDALVLIEVRFCRYLFARENADVRCC